MDRIKDRKELTMTCASATKHWTIYNAKTRQFISLSHGEFKDLIVNEPVKLTGRFIDVGKNDKMWIDGLLNSTWFK